MLIKAFVAANWAVLEKGYNEWSRDVEVLSITTHVDRDGVMQLLAVYRKNLAINPASIN